MGREPNPSRRTPSAAVQTALVGASFAVGAVGTLLFLTGGSIRAPEPVTPAVEAALEDTSSATTTRETREPEIVRKSPENRASPPPVTSRRAPRPVPDTARPRDSAVDPPDLAPATLPLYGRPLPRAVGPTSSEPDGVDLDVLFDVPTGGQIVLPVKTKNVEPDYPRIARKARIGGTVVLEAVITAEGRVADVRVANSAPLLDDAAVAAIRKWQYEPGQLNQLPVAMPVTINVAFSMH